MIRAGLLETAAFGGMTAFGLVVAVLGATLPVLAQQLHFDIARSGNLFLVMSAVMLVTTLALGPALDRFGLKAAFLLGPAFTAAAIARMAWAGAFADLIEACALLGIGGGILNGSTNTLVADLHQDPRRKNARLNLLGMFFGVGALIVPLAIGGLLPTVGLRGILLGAAALAAAPAALSAPLTFPAPKLGSASTFAELARLATNPAVLAFALLLLFQSGNEFSVSGYLTSYLTTELNMPVSAASYLLSAYWAAVLAQRVALSRIALHVRGETIVLAGAAGEALSICLLILARSAPLAIVAVLLLGFSISCIFTTTLGLAGARFASHSGTVFGFLIAGSLVGGMTEPWAVAHIAGVAGLRPAFSLPAVAAVAILAIQCSVSDRHSRN